MSDNKRDKNVFGYLLIMIIVFLFLKHNENKNIYEHKKEEIKNNIIQEETIFNTKINKLDLPTSNEEYILENDELKITFSNVGAQIKSVELKKYKKDKSNVFLVNKNSSLLNFTINNNSDKIETKNLLFDVVKKEKNKIEFEHMNTANEKLTLIFEIDKERPFVVKIYFNIKNDRATKNILFSFIDIFECQEKNIEESKNKFTIKLCDYKNDINNFYSNSLNVEKKKKENIKWTAFMQKYFTTGLYFKNTNNDTNIHIAPGTDNIEKKTSITTEFRDCNNVDLEYYFGPNSLKELKTLNSNFDEIMYYGIPGVRVFNKYIVLPLVKIFEKKNVNIGIIIILLVLLLKILLLPLNLKSYKTIAKMKQINPLLKELNEKYGEDKQRLAFEQINLYRKYGVNPLGSLVPLLLQFPFLIAMFNFIPIEISFRNKSFLWCNDMSTYDSILNLGFNIPFYGDHISLFALLMTLTTVLYSLYSMSSESSKSSFWITIFIPLFFLGISNRFCGALNFYYLIFNIITLIIQFFIKKFFIKDTDIKKNY